MPRVSTVFTSDDADIAKAYQRMQRANDKLLQQNQKLRQASKKGGDEQIQLSSRLSRTYEKHVVELRSMAAQYLSVGAAVNIVGNAYTAWRMEMEELAAASDKLNKSMVKGLSIAGDLADSQRVSEFVNRQPDATREQAQQAVQAINAGAKDQPLDRRFELAHQATRVAPLQIDIKDFSAVLAEVAQAMPNKSAGDVADLSLSMMEKAEVDPSKLADAGFQRGVSALSKTGLTQEEAFAMGVQSSANNLDSEFLGALASKLGMQIDAPKPIRGRQLNQEQLDLKAFAETADGRQRLDMLRDNVPLQQKILGSEQAVKFRELDIDAAMRRAAELAKDQQGDFIGRRLEQLAKTPEGAAVAQQQRIAVRGDTQRFKRIREAQATQFTRVQDELAAMMDAEGWGPLNRLASNAMLYPMTALFESSGDSMPAVTALGSMIKTDPALSPEARARFHEFMLEEARITNLNETQINNDEYARQWQQRDAQRLQQVQPMTPSSPFWQADPQRPAAGMPAANDGASLSPYGALGPAVVGPMAPKVAAASPAESESRLLAESVDMLKSIHTTLEGMRDDQNKPAAPEGLARGRGRGYRDLASASVAGRGRHSES